MYNLIRLLREFLAKRYVHKNCDFTAGQNSKINFRQLGRRLPAKLAIGSETITQCVVTADRNVAVVSIGNNTFIGGSTLVCAEQIEIGNDVMISWGCTIIDHNAHAVNWKMRIDDVRDTMRGTKDWTNVKIKPVRICDKAWIGFNSLILKGVTIGEGAIVGAGSVVTRDVAPFTIVAGNPARVVSEMVNES